MSEIRTAPISELKAAVKREVSRDLAETELSLRLSDVTLRRSEITMKAAEQDRALLASERRQVEVCDEEERTIRELLERHQGMSRALRAVPYGDGARSSPRGEYGLGRGARSWIGDVVAAELGHDRDAERRLMDVAETRAVSSTTGAGGGFVPPQYHQEEWAAFARGSRPFADACRSVPLPQFGVSINIPRVTTGSTVAVQAGEAGAVADTSIADTELTVAVTTIAGKTDLSRQAFERSTPGLDEVIGMDLAADYARLLDTECLNGTGANHQTGVLQLSGTNSVTLSTATVAAFYPKLSDAIQRIHSLRYAPPSAIVMHPRRWAWLLAAVDSSGRPLVVPNAQAPMNALASFSRVASQAIVGTMQGLPVIVDANIPTTNGAGTNEDAVIVLRTDDVIVMESGTPTVKVYEEVVSGNLQVRVQVYGYLAFACGRYPAGISKVTGAGLAAPSW